MISPVGLPQRSLRAPPPHRAQRAGVPPLRLRSKSFPESNAGTQGGLFATFCEKIGNPLNKECFTTRGSIIFPFGGKKTPPKQRGRQRKETRRPFRFSENAFAVQFIADGLGIVEVQGLMTDLTPYHFAPVSKCGGVHFWF